MGLDTGNICYGYRRKQKHKDGQMTEEQMKYALEVVPNTDSQAQARWIFCVAQYKIHSEPIS